MTRHWSTTREAIRSSPRLDTTPTTDFQTEWLPTVRQPPFLSKPMLLTDMKPMAKRDWHLNLAQAIADKKNDGLQARMLGKLYFFIRDVIPQGLNGDYAHIDGSDVMRHLVCCSGDPAPAKHRVSREASEAWKQLETWMKRGKHWREALAAAGVATSATQSRARQRSSKAPGLYSPEGLLAVLVLAYPDPKFKNKIISLQMTWLLRPRGSLDVKEGFWQGLNSNNIHEVFDDEGLYRPGVYLLADYSRLLGADFVDCRRDIRPYLDAWAKPYIRLDHEPDLSDIDSISSHSAFSPVGSINAFNDSNGSVATLEKSASVPSITDDRHRATNTSAGRERGDTAGLGKDADGPTANTEGGCDGFSLDAPPNIPNGDISTVASKQEVLSLLNMFESKSKKSPKELFKWLLEELVRDGEVLSIWCHFWADRINEAPNYEQQVIMRSLFSQSLHRLEHLYSSLLPIKPQTYILQDMEDAGVRELGPSDQRCRQMKKHPQFKACDTAHTQLISRIASSQAHNFMQRLFAFQTQFFVEIMVDRNFSPYLEDLMALDELRTQCLLYRLKKPLHPPGEVNSILHTDTIATLRLTKWQQQMLVAGADPRTVLTDWQLHIHRQKTASTDDMNSVSSKDMSRFPAGLYGNVPMNDHISEAPVEPDVLRKLFGVIPEPTIPESTASSRFASPNLALPQPVVPAQQKTLHSTARPEPSFSALPVGNADCFSSVESRSRSPSIRKAKNPLANFFGKTFDPGSKKRSRSPTSIEDRPLKVPKLRDMSREDMITDLQACKDQLKTDLNDLFQRNVTQAFNHFTNDVVCTIKRDLNQSIRNEIEKFKVEVLRSVGDDLSQKTGHIDTELASINKGVSALDRRLQALAIATTEVAKVREAVQSVQSRLDAVDRSLSKTAQIGEDGYLTQNCPAPQGSDQKAYESTLILAAITYISFLGVPVSGVGRDGEAIIKTVAKFPNLPHEHIFTALDHVHQQAWGCPFPPLDEDDMVDDDESN